MKRISFVLICCAGTLFLSNFMYKTMMEKYKRLHSYYAFTGFAAKALQPSWISNFSRQVGARSEKSSSRTAKEPTAKLVILLAQTRSGSSFLGEIFNQNREVAYFYEPLYPFGDCPRTTNNSMENEVLAYFHNVLRYDFNAIRELYRRAFEQPTRKKAENGCLRTGVCFSDCSKCAGFIHRNKSVCSPTNANKCSTETFLQNVTNLSRTAKLIAFKVCYLCDISWIETLLKNQDYDIKIVHLVRDPRAIVNSKINYKDNPKTIEDNKASKLTTVTCQHVETMTKYADENLVGSKHYLRVRHEDFSLHPIEGTERIYKFVGLQIAENVRQWLLKATSSKNDKSLSKKIMFGTRRDSSEVVVSWRKQLLLKQIKLVQQHCHSYMLSSNYAEFEDEASARNLNVTSF